MTLLVRAGAVWLLLLIGAIVNGGVRQAFLVASLGESRAHVVSTLLLCSLIFGIGWVASGWLDLRSAGEAWLVGVGWLLLTIAFEFLAGHFLFGTPWPTLLADYDLSRGRIWILVLIVTALTPPVTRWLNR